MSNSTDFRLNGKTIKDALKANRIKADRPAILKRFLEAAIKKGGTRRAAAALLSVEPTQFYHWIHQAGMSVDKTASQYGALAGPNSIAGVQGKTGRDPGSNKATTKKPKTAKKTKATKHTKPLKGSELRSEKTARRRGHPRKMQQANAIPPMEKVDTDNMNKTAVGDPATDE